MSTSPIPEALSIAGRRYTYTLAVAHFIVVFAFLVQAHFRAFYRESVAASAVTILPITFGLAVVASIARFLAFDVIRHALAFIGLNWE
jgi:hypothetical protein